MLSHLGDGRFPPQKGALGLFFSPLLAVFKDISPLKGYLMKLNHLHLLTSDLKTKAAGFLHCWTTCIYLYQNSETHRKTESMTPWASDSHPFLQNGLFCFSPGLQTKFQGLKSNLVMPSVLCFLNRMFIVFSFSSNWLR